MTNEELLKLINDKPDSFVQIIKAKNRGFYDEIDKKYAIDGKFSEKIYKHLYPQETGVCKQCNVNKTKFMSFFVGYVQYCGKKCANNASASTRAETMIENNKKTRHEYYEKINCIVCNVEFEALKYRKQKCCSNACSAKNTAADPDRLRKIKQTKLERYGSENYVNTDKYKATCLEKYGVDNIFKFKQSTKMASEHKSKIEHAQKLAIYNSVISRLKKLSTAEPLFTIEEYVSSDRKNSYRFKCTTCKNEFSDNIDNGELPRCLTCYPILGGKSKAETEIYEYVCGLIGKQKVISGDTSLLDGLELDIFIPSKNIAIEYDGVYWHSENKGKKDINYHINKTKLCLDRNVKLLHIFEDEWIYNEEIIKNKLSHILDIRNNKAIYAKKCKIDVIQDCSDFLEKTHIQGNCPASIKIGAYYNNELVAVMTFGKPRIALGSKSPLDGEYELLRFSTNKRVVGIGGKLLSFFIKTYSPSKIITFADRRYSIGNLYDKLGFKKTGETPPNYWYFKGGDIKRYHRFTFRKDQLSKKLKTFDANLSEWQNMKNNGYDRIWDCGSIKYELVISNKIS